MNNNSIKVKIRFSLLIIVFSLTASNAWCQKNNTLAINYGCGGNLVLVNAFEKREGYSNDGMFSIGISYQHKLSGTLAIKTELNYSKNNILINFDNIQLPPYLAPSSRHFDDSKSTTELLSIPLYINYQFTKLLFIEGGPIIDIYDPRFLTKSILNHIGIGAGIGVGGIYNYNNFNLTLNPFVNYHSIINFSPFNRNNLCTFGVKCSVGYSF